MARPLPQRKVRNSPLPRGPHRSIVATAICRECGWPIQTLGWGVWLRGKLPKGKAARCAYRGRHIPAKQSISHVTAS